MAMAADEIPQVVRDYIRATSDGRVDDVVACFAPDALVHDEKADHRGIEAIRAWVEDTTSRYQPKNEILTARTNGEETSAEVQVTGMFPGSPITLEFTFTVSGERITRLCIR